MLSKIQRLVLLALLPSLAHAQTGNSYSQTNLVSDGSVKAQQTDTQLINPWGVAIGKQTPFWINAAGSGSRRSTTVAATSNSLSQSPLRLVQARPALRRVSHSIHQ